MEIINRKKQLAKNTMILSVGTLGSKIFSFLLLPLYTAVLTTEDYGNIDVLQTIISLAVPILTLQLSAAVFRFIIEHNEIEDRKLIISSAFIVSVFATIIFVFLTMVYYYFFQFNHCCLFLLAFVSTVVYLMIQSVVRGFGDNITYSVCGFLTVSVSIIINIILIVGIGMRGEAILIAMIVSNIVATSWGCIRVKIFKYISFNCFSRKKIKEMLKYSLPLIPNAISWWIANASDRLIIAIVLGSAMNGIYAVANKIPSIYTHVFNVFNIAWVESVSRCQNDADKESFINDMLEQMYRFLGCLCLGIICCISLCFDFLVGENYASSYPHIYILMIAIFVNSICSMYGGIFTGYMKSSIIGFSTFIGACVNIIFNVLFIRHIGVFAASISTLVAYVVILVIRIVKIGTIIKLHYPIAYFIRFTFFLAVVSLGYFLRIPMLNFGIVVMITIWAIYENKTLLVDVLNSFNSKLVD